MVIFKRGVIPIDVKLVKVSALQMHEKIIPEKLQKLKLYLRNKTVLKNPIIIDTNYIILDGNHRANAFKELNFKYICACQIDYFNKHVKLRYWDRKISSFMQFEALKQYLTKENVKLIPCQTREALLEKQKVHVLSFGLHYQDHFLLIKYPREQINTAVSAYNQLEKIQEFIGTPLAYFPDKYLSQNKFLDSLAPHDLLISTPRILKDMVVKATRNDLIFAPKSTRHLIPSRPLNIDLPLNILNSNMSYSQASAELEKFLKRKAITRFGPGQVIEGRYYEEEVLVFLDKKLNY
ncbi:MAG: ParB N-terminal domain-containing protein [Promethearchaeia archaeon]